MESKEEEPTAPLLMTSASGDMDLHVSKEMPSFMETGSSAQEQATPYPGPYVYQQQPPPYPGPYVDQQQAPPYTGPYVNQQQTLPRPDPYANQLQSPSQVQPQMIVVQNGGNAVPPVGPRSIRLICPSCNAYIKTSVSSNSTGCAYIWCFFMICCVCWLCSCLPFCMESCKVFKHTCPKCKAYIGTYRP